MSLVVSDTAAMAIAAAIKAQTAANTANTVAITAALEKQFGTAGAAFPGSLTAVAGVSAKNLLEIASLLKSQNTAIRELQIATGNISKSLETLSNGLATVQFTMTKQLITTQLSTADQIAANKYNKTTSDAALERAGLPKTEIPEEKLDEAVLEGYKTVNLMETQAKVIGIVNTAVTDATVAGFAEGKKWLLQTTFGKWFTDEFGKAKASFVALFAEEEAKEKLKEARNTVANAAKNPTMS